MGVCGVRRGYEGSDQTSAILFQNTFENTVDDAIIMQGLPGTFFGPITAFGGGLSREFGRVGTRGMMMGSSGDVLGSGETVLGGDSVFSDGDWFWRGDLWFYVRKHNVRLPDQFLALVRERQYLMPAEKEPELGILAQKLQDCLMVGDDFPTEQPQRWRLNGL